MLARCPFASFLTIPPPSLPLPPPQGINTLQSLGFLNPASGGAEPLQQSLNRFSLERLNEYAVRAGHSHGPALAALNAHFGPRGHRPPKDTEMFALVRSRTIQTQIVAVEHVPYQAPVLTQATA